MACGCEYHHGVISCVSAARMTHCSLLLGTAGLRTCSCCVPMRNAVSSPLHAHAEALSASDTCAAAAGRTRRCASARARPSTSRPRCSRWSTRRRPTCGPRASCRTSCSRAACPSSARRASWCAAALARAVRIARNFAFAIFCCALRARVRHVEICAQQKHWRWRCGAWRLDFIFRNELCELVKQKVVQRCLLGRLRMFQP